MPIEEGAGMRLLPYTSHSTLCKGKAVGKLWALGRKKTPEAAQKPQMLCLRNLGLLTTTIHVHRTLSTNQFLACAY